MVNRIIYNLGINYKTILHFNALFNITSQKTLTFGKTALSGRNNRCISTTKGPGGGHQKNIEF